MIGTSWDQDTITLRYRKAHLNDIDSLEVLRVVLKHEVCHVLSIPSSKLQLSSSLPAQVAYVDLYREYLAHREFLRRFKNDKELFLAHEKRAFKPDKAFSGLNAALKNCTGIMPFLITFEGLFRVYYDAIYFYLVGDLIFQKYCEVRKAESVYQLGGLIMEDMAHIEAQPSPYERKISLMEDSFKCVFNVDLGGLLRNRLSLCQPLDKLPWEIAGNIVALWRARNLPIAER
jgi:hypothetical protein